MYAFLILLFPIALFRHLMRSFSKKLSKPVMAARTVEFCSPDLCYSDKTRCCPAACTTTLEATTWAAAAIAIVLCACKAFLTFSYRVASASFIREWLYSFVYLTAVPLLCALIILFFVKLRTKSIDECALCVFATLAAFMAVHLPFTTLSGPRSVYSAYELFCRPPLYLMMITSVSICAALGAEKKIKMPQLAAVLPVLAVFLAAPSVIDTLWFMNMGNWFVPWCVYMGLSLAWYIVCSLKMLTPKA